MSPVAPIQITHVKAINYKYGTCSKKVNILHLFNGYRYGHTTRMGTGACTDVGSAILLRSKSQPDGSIRLARRFGMLVDSGIYVDRTEKRKAEFCLSVAG